MTENWIAINLNTGTLETAERFLKAFGGLAVPGIQRAMNRALAGVRTDAVRAVREVYNVKADPVRKSFTLHKAGQGGSAHGGMHGGRLSASAVSHGRRISLMEFGPRPQTSGRKRMPKVGASVMIQKGVRKTISGAFVGTSTKGKRRLYIRHKKNRLPIRPLYGPSVPQMIGAMGHPDIYSTIRKNAEARYEKNFEHEMNRLLEKLGVR